MYMYVYIYVYIYKIMHMYMYHHVPLYGWVWTSSLLFCLSAAFDFEKHVH